jgi:uncharacterized membrane protein YciS (DUF1049 family)
METMPWTGFGFVTLVAVVFGVILAVLAMLMPFFVFRLRNEMIRLNKQVGRAVELLNVIAQTQTGGRS